MLLTNSFCVHKKSAEKMDLFYFQVVIHFLSTKKQKIMLYPIVLKKQASCSSNKVHTQDDNQTE